MRKYLYVLLAAGLLLGACSEEADGAQEEAVDEKEQQNESAENVEKDGEAEAEEYTGVYPLTGLGTNDQTDRRMVAVMINNHAKARPQSGLTDADMVFEILAEGNITRLLAIYQSELPEKIGPVRSAREYYFELAENYGALYIYHGAAGFINEMIANRGIEHLDGAMYDNNGILFKRENFRQAPHNSYLLTEGVDPAAERKGYELQADYEPLPFLSEKEAGELNGEAVSHAEITYGKNPMEIVEFEYDTGTETYKRYNDREQTVERETGEPVEVENVFIVEADHQVIDDQGRRAVDLASGGDAYLLQKGTVQPLEWENRDGRILPVKDGNPAGFVPGSTWINVVPADPGISNSVHLSH
ncbi:DUF3048 domain-containing protein [Virgibacillus xinjiangensis]|uniref:DUF3048 domain-containing protein n=1 Tax=Virgibacillus xinjiangensis TaxID=393090 RepID=A0ABV7CT39_9BACI